MSEFSLYGEIAQGLKEAISYERGESNARTTRISCRFSAPPEWTPDEIKQIRLAIPMTQRSFADFMGVSLKTVETWECGRNRPNGSASRLMQIISRGWDSTKFITHTRM